MKKKTNVNFSKHELKVTNLEGVTIHEFKKPETIIHRLVFINTCGIMSVTGDFGKWIFCREFHPSGDYDSGVSGGYWDEKLEINSVQKSHAFDSDETLKAIDEFKENFEDYYGRTMNEDELDWLEKLDNSVFDEHEYIYVAYRENPSSIDYDEVPYGTKRHPWLDAVYDGFDAICQYLKNNLEQSLIKKRADLLTRITNINECYYNDKQLNN